MEPSERSSSTSLFQVFLRLRPPPEDTHSTGFKGGDRFIDVHNSGNECQNEYPTHITVTPPVESRKKAVERFGFTRVFEEEATQLELLEGTGLVSLVENLLGKEKGGMRDGLFATLGVTGSGKSHTLLGSKEQRGLTQLTLDILFRSLDGRLVRPIENSVDFCSIVDSDPSEGYVVSAELFFEASLGEKQSAAGDSRAGTPGLGTSRTGTPAFNGSRAPTPGFWAADHSLHPSSVGLYPPLLGLSTGKSPRGKGDNQAPISSKRNILPRLSELPQVPDASDFVLEPEENTEYAVLISMYEVYNDRIFDLLGDHASATPTTRAALQKELRRRALLFKPTEMSPDRKVVAGLRKILCADLDEALMVLETGLAERKVSGTNSNSVSSRSHGFFCLEVKKRVRGSGQSWSGATLTLVDLAGSERARNAKTSGSTLAEAGKINESLMYLGQCLQMQSDIQEGGKSHIVPFRQCKLTELLFSNSFPSLSSASHHSTVPRRNPQKAIMVVTADPIGDFNATSQILRYSALAREVTVPRVPSTSSTILAGYSSKNQHASGRDTPSVVLDELEIALQEIAKLKDEVSTLKNKLSEEVMRRQHAERAWEAAEEKTLQIEQEIREACSLELDMKLEEEQRKWKRAWEEEADRHDEHMDRKIELVTQSIKIHEDPAPTEENLVNELEAENNLLRRKLNAAERELLSKSPTRSTKPKNKHLASALPIPSSPLFSSPLSESAPRDLNISSNLGSSFDSDQLDRSINEDMDQMSLTPIKKKSPTKNNFQTSSIPLPLSHSSASPKENEITQSPPKKKTAAKKVLANADTDTDKMELDHSTSCHSLVGAPTMQLKSPAAKRIPMLKKKQGKRKLLTSRRRDLALSDDEDGDSTYDQDGFLI